ncbi:RND transporter, partial [Burkholderia sp. Tr-862]|nr:RND transporter [Burkholderia sp. Tr-862]
NARLDELRATGARFADTARLYQAMGTPPVDGAGKDGKAGKADTAGNPGNAAHDAPATQVRTAAPDAPPSQPLPQ